MENFQNTEGWSSWNAGKAAPEEHSHPAWRTYAPTGVKKDDDDDDDRTNYSSWERFYKTVLHHAHPPSSWEEFNCS